MPTPNGASVALPGLVKYQFAPVNTVAAVPDTYGVQELSSAITFTGSHDWLTGYATQGTLQLRETPAGNGLLVYEQVITGKVPDISSALLQQLEEMQRHYHLVICQDAKGRQRLVGSLEAGASFAFSHDTATLQAGYHGYSFTFRALSAYPALVYNP